MVYSYILLGIAIITLVKAVAIREGMLFDMLTGYNPDNIKDKEGFSKWVSENVLIFSGLSFFSGFAASAVEWTGIYLLAGLIIIAFPAIVYRTMQGMKKYEKRRLSNFFTRHHLGFDKKGW